MRSVAARLPAAAPPPHAAGGHEGGVGNRGKENQDAWFVAHPSRDLAVYAVFDGHGKRFGKLAAHVAAATVRVMLCHHHRWVVDHPEAALKAAFAEAHDAIRKAMLRADSTLRQQPGRSGTYLLQWVEPSREDDEPAKWDAVDGGTTASVVCLIRNEAAVVGVVGDSSVVLLGRDKAGRPASMLLVEEHSPVSLKEYERVTATPSGPQVPQNGPSRSRCPPTQHGGRLHFFLACARPHLTPSPRCALCTIARTLRSSTFSNATRSPAPHASPTRAFAMPTCTSA